jgi:aminoglycoside phosphotransferase (APT) family kinase protein
VPGETLARRIRRDPEYAEARPRLARQMGEAAARIHGIDLTAAGALRRTNVGLALETSYAHYRSLGMDRPVVEWAFRWLSDNRPPDEMDLTVVHGDMRNGNVIVGPEGLRAVLDWEVVHLGDPMEDLGWMCVTSWRFGEIDKAVGGFGSREDLFAGYEAAGGRKVDPARVKFWEVMGTLRWGLSCAMMAREFQSGDRSVERAAIGRRASETEIDLLSILAPRGGLAHA